jgi:hypothetical protein
MSIEMRGEIGTRLAALVREGTELVDDLAGQDDDHWVDDAEVVVHQKWLASVGNALLLTGGADSSYVSQFREVVNSQKNPAGLMVYVVRKVFGLLLSVLEEWSHGTLKMVESIVTPAVFDDMLDEAAGLEGAGRMLESTVLASSVLRLTLKKVAIRHKQRVIDKTPAELLAALTKASVFNQRQHERLTAGLVVGDAGSSKGWDTIETAELEELIETTRKLVSGFL